MSVPLSFFYRQAIASSLLISAAVGIAQAQVPVSAPPAVVRLSRSPTLALESLQREHSSDDGTFVAQEELDGLIDPDGGGACASAAAIDSLQAIRRMAGAAKLPNPHKVALKAFVDQPVLLKGRVTNQQLLALLSFYQIHLDGHKLALEATSAPRSSYSEGGPIWRGDVGPELAVSDGVLKILSYTVSKPAGEVIGRHFVLLKTYANNEVSVLDPTAPTKDRRYILELRAGPSGIADRVFLLNPAGIPRRDSLVYELNTVFKMSLAGGKPQGIAGSTEQVMSRFSQTAAELRGTKSFLDPRAWRKVSSAYGLPGLDLPAEHGGSAWTPSKMIEVFEHAGRYNLNFRDVVGGAHVRPLLKSKHPDILAIVRQVAAGEGYIAIAITEPGVGSDVSSIKSSAHKVDGGYVLSGTKRFNARLDQASHVIIFTQSAAGGDGKLSAFVLPIDTPGLKIERFQAHGLTGNSYGGVSFSDLRVPDAWLIGEDGEGLGIFFEHFLYWRLMQAAAAIGTGEDALVQMANRIKTREAFGGPIGRFTHLQQPIGQYWTELQMAHALAREAAALLDRGDYHKARPLIDGLKAEGVEIALRATDAAMRAFGGEGYSGLVDIGDRLRDLQGLRIADGTTDVMRMDVVRRTFGEEFWRMSTGNE